MSVSLLHEAASMMRERAETARGLGVKPWRVDGVGIIACGGTHIANPMPDVDQHIASWHPVVALAVADWLDTTAFHVASHECEAECRPSGCQSVADATAVARAYLGRDS